MRLHRRTISCVLFISAAVGAFGFNFSVSPTEEGGYDVHADHGWSYPGGYLGSATLDIGDLLSVARDDSSYNFTKSLVLEAGLEVLAKHFPLPVGSLRLAGAVEYSRSPIHELGYFDASGVRYYIINDRVVQGTNPELRADWSLVVLPKFDCGITLGVRYAPVCFLSLTQDLYVSAPTAVPALDMERVGFSSRQMAWNGLAFDFGTQFALNGVFGLDLAASWQRLRLPYDCLAIDGSEQRIDNTEDILDLSALLRLDCLPIGGARAKIGVAYRLVSSLNNQDGKRYDEDRIRFLFGFSI